MYESPITDFEEFIKQFNLNLPQDIKALFIKEVDKKNLINSKIPLQMIVRKKCKNKCINL